MAQPKYFRPVGIRRKFGAIFDEKGDEINESERGLNDICDIDKHNPPLMQTEKHHWLLLPKEEGQKQYLYCLKCGLTSHF